jgi:hypothetical protein
VLQGPIAGIGPVTLPETTGERPAWHPARLEVVPVIDARGWISATLEYTPGRFDR